MENKKKPDGGPANEETEIDDKDTTIDLNFAIVSPDGNVYLPDGVLKKYQPLRISDTTEIENPTPIVRIGGEVISTEGNLTTLSGASKSGKSAFTSVIIAGGVTDEFSNDDGFPDVEITQNTHHKAVLHFDTEQARHKHKSNLISIRNRAGLTVLPDFFYSYNIRELDISEYTKVTTDIISAASKKHGGIFMIVIDGVADFIRDVNDPDQSNAIVSFFEKLAIQHRCPVITIVHTNPNSDKERGHLGSQLQRKSESVLMVKTDNDISTLEPKFLRNAGKGNIPLIQFMYDPVKNYHTFCGIRPNDDAKRAEARLDAIKVIAHKVFSGQQSYFYSDAVEAIMRASKKGTNGAKEIFKEMKAHEMIAQGDDKKWRLDNTGLPVYQV